LSTANAYYFKGSAFTGLGSPHTPHRYIWPLAHMVDALTTEPTDAGGASLCTYSCFSQQLLLSPTHG